MSILEVSFRGIEKNEGIDEVIGKKVEKLEEIFPDLIGCRIAISQPQHSQRSGSPYRVRIDITVPGNEFVVTRESGEGDMHEPLNRVLGDAFEAARRILREHAQRQRGDVKAPAEEETTALVVRLFPSEGYGFLKTLEGEEIYFHKNSVLHHDFDRLEIGTMVRYAGELGENGLQASSVQIIDKPGASIPKTEKLQKE
ncbi:MAG: HPF/RaiA family ribosome-associated protein [Syntrophorhabdaceae bacterium]